MAAANGNLTARWQAWSERFAAMRPREKQLVGLALAAAIVFVGYSFWIEPGKLHAARLRQTLAQQQDEQAQLLAQVKALAAENRDPDAARRVQLQQLRERLAALDTDLKAFDRTLVAPAQAPALLQTLLAHHRGLSLISLTTLAPQPLIDPPEKRVAKDGAKPATAETAPAMPGGNIYKHGIEIKLAGKYHDLLAYVSELEASPQKLLWGGMRLTVKNHPISELTLTVYTLSLDETWLLV
jgi:MSHA biogenesis protein MshJ